MNPVNEDVVRSIIKLLERGAYLAGKGDSTADYDFDSEGNEGVLHERIEELELEVKELQDELYERDVYMIIQENEALTKEIDELREENSIHKLAFNRHINSVIDMLEDEKYLV